MSIGGGFWSAFFTWLQGERHPSLSPIPLGWLWLLAHPTTGPVVKCELLWPPGLTQSDDSLLQEGHTKHVPGIYFSNQFPDLALEVSRSFPGAIWMYIPVRFWPRIPKHLEMKLPDVFRHSYVPYFWEIWKHNLSISTIGWGLCLSITWNFLQMYIPFLQPLKKWRNPETWFAVAHGI